MAVLVNESMASSPSTGTIDSNTAACTWNASGFFTLNNNVNQYGDFYYVGDITTAFTMDVDMQETNTSGADSSWFFWGWGSGTRPHTESDSTSAGYLFERNDFDGFIRLRFAGSELHAASWTEDTTFDTLEITQNAGTFTVKYQGSAFFTYTDPSYPRTLPGTTYGWGARSGGTGNTHNIKNLLLQTNGGTTTQKYNHLPLLGIG